MEIVFKIVTFLWLLATLVKGAKIIVLEPGASRSHLNFIRPLIHELASRGHELTWVLPYEEDKPVPTIRYIVIKANGELFTNQEFQKTMMGKVTEKQNMISKINTMLGTLFWSGENYLNNSDVQRMIQAGKQYDLAIVGSFMCESALMTSPYLAKHIVIFSANVIATTSKSSPPLPIATLSVKTEPLTFYERLKQTFLFHTVWTFFMYIANAKADEVVKKQYPELPTANEMFNRASLTLLNSDPAIFVPKPGIPNYVNLGGIHCKPAKALPKEMAEFVESSGDDGFLYFSLGSVMQAKFMSDDYREHFLQAFSRLKQKVIWKFEVKLENLPPNVMITPWAPQQDLLGHPKIKLFFTHGGLLSCQEAVYHGVPVLGVGLFADQPTNIQRLVNLGVADELDFLNMSSDIIYTKIKNIVDDPKYKMNMEKYSRIFRDEMDSPLERGVHWIDYVLRHDGAFHLMTPSIHLDTYQYLIFDIGLLLTLVISLYAWITIKTIKFVLRKRRTNVYHTK